MCEIFTSNEAFNGVNTVQNVMLYDIPGFTKSILPTNNHQPNPQQLSNNPQEYLPNTTTHNGDQPTLSTNFLANNNNQQVHTTKFIIDSIWINFPVHSTAQVIPLRVFIQEILRRSRTSWSTLQTTLFYMVRVKPQIELLWSNSISSDQRTTNDSATCGRRMFLASLIVASKYLQDRNYSNYAWSKICGLPVQEINSIERRFLMLIGYNLFISENNFKHWSNLLNSHMMAISGSTENASGVTLKKEENQNITQFKQMLWMLRPQSAECSVQSVKG
ncbi:2414_t:CDS:2 [Diversispora eburnea]|uniref:2414_t:CDS:1 n=1 Tax=Diversispora eburnea TaxID=1213867 RepID=A0A9N9BL08_9GLOM|nr:2414_t:CDS:2 [Diversispora eburnea]